MKTLHFSPISGFSARAETQFLGDFVFPPWRKRGFRVILIFRRGGSVLFLVFHSSSMDETQILPFFTRHPWMKRSFWAILRFVGRRQTIFIVFCISSADDGRFSGHF